MADIEPLRKGDKSWGTTAAAADAQNRAPNDAPFIAVWIETNEKGEQIVKWSKANISYRDYCFIGVALMEFAQSCVREAMEKE